jgi:hypothetical protein
MNLPITSRLKRVSALKKTRQQDSAIDPDNPSATVGGGIKSPDIITNESVTSEDPKLTSFKERCGKYGGVNSAAAAADGCVWSDDAKDPDPIVTNTQTTTPGENTTWEGTLKKTTKGDVFNPWETRAQSRSIKKEGRDNRRSDIKKAKNEARGAGTFDKDGVYTEGAELKGKAKREYIKKARQKAKAKELAFESREFEAASERNSKSRASGKRGGSTDVITGQRDKMQSELSPAEEKAMLERQAIAAAAAAATATAKKKSPNPMKASSPYKMKGSMFQKRY